MSDTSSEGIDYEAWDERYRVQLLDLYRIFQSYGEILFGSAFHQLGNVDTFVRYVQGTTLLVNSNL